jgi:hypothetical protein
VSFVLVLVVVTIVIVIIIVIFIVIVVVVVVVFVIPYAVGLKRNNVVAKLGDVLSMNIAVVDPNGNFLPRKEILVEVFFIARDEQNEIAKEIAIGVC